jgi:serine protease Do
MHTALPSRRRFVSLLLALAAATQLLQPPRAQAVESEVERQAQALQRASAAVVGLVAQAVDGARSAATLGPVRLGSGVVIGAEGLVLTIGYLVLEAEQVELATDDGRRLPARVVAYDLASGFGLVQALAPLKLAPVPLGRADGLRPNEPLIVVSGGAQGAVSMAQLLSRRGYSGWWEYHLDSALFTAPARPDHSGAALFNTRGELLGIGSLLLPNVAEEGRTRQSGNLFVPTELLPPILAELQRDGQSRASQRAWLGMNCSESDGELRIVRVNEDSPADVAGLERGDRILRIDGRTVAKLESLWKALWSGGSAERAVTLDIERSGRPLTVVVQSVDRAKTLRRPQGI